jgi:HlyD family secretion protein
MSPLPSIAMLLACAVLVGCSGKPPPTLQGYVEGEFILLAAPAAGTLEKLHVSRGQQVEAGAPVFALERTNEEAARREAAQRIRNAEQRLANLRAPRRAPEIEAASALAAQIRATRELSTLQLTQQERLYAAGFISQAQLDAARANSQRDAARVAEVEAQNRLAGESIGREAEIRAAGADVETARAALAQADWRLGQRVVASPLAALVQDTFYLGGEWVPSGRPVVSLLPPVNVKVRFFVPEQTVGSIKQGDAVTVSCDGCAAPIRATISFISRQAEFTPPVIYSKDSRAKLVFMVEARAAPEHAVKLRPGQPVDVALGGR